MLDTMALTRAFLRNQTDNGAVKSVTGLLSWPLLSTQNNGKSKGNPVLRSLKRFGSSIGILNASLPDSERNEAITSTYLSVASGRKT